MVVVMDILFFLKYLTLLGSRIKQHLRQSLGEIPLIKKALIPNGLVFYNPKIKQSCDNLERLA
jgi:hypothetical protein